MSEFSIEVTISIVRDGDAVPTIIRQTFRDDSRHIVIHQARRWAERELANYGVEVSITPLSMEKASANAPYHEWFYDATRTIKIRAARGDEDDASD